LLNYLIEYKDYPGASFPKAASYQKIEVNEIRIACRLSAYPDFPSPVMAQSQQEDSIFYQSSVANTLTVYYDQLEDQSQIYNGSLYYALDLNFQSGSPYLLTEKSVKGWIVYDHILYPNLNLVYEDYRQYLVAIDQSFQLKLINERISSFTIADRHFERQTADSLETGIPAIGFYEVLYSGRSRVLKRTIKKIREVLGVTNGLTRFMDETGDYYLRNGKKYLTINTKRELLNIMNDHRKEVQRFIRKNNLHFKTDKDKDLVMVAAYYDQIANR
jgi:hypothetical protein